MVWTSVILLSLTSLVSAGPLNRRWDDFVVKHTWNDIIPKGWEFQSLPPPNTLIDLRLGLKSGRLEELFSHLSQTSDPSHERYGNHLSKEEVDELVAPHGDTISIVEEWLKHHAVQGSSSAGAGDWVNIRLPVKDAERMLDTQFGVYHHASSGEVVLRSLSYSLPRDLAGHIDTVSPTTYFGTMKSTRATSFIMPDEPELKEDSPNAVPPASCSSRTTIACLKTLYNVRGPRSYSIELPTMICL